MGTTDKKLKEKFVRWQGIAITQLSYSVNLILTLSVAALGFGASLSFDTSFHENHSIKCLYVVSMVILLLSAVLGIGCTMSRMCDFRTTKEILKQKRKRNRESGAECLGKIKAKIKNLKKKAKDLGKVTWCLFWCQIGTFGAGVFLLVLSIGLHFS